MCMSASCDLSLVPGEEHFGIAAFLGGLGETDALAAVLEGFGGEDASMAKSNRRKRRKPTGETQQAKTNRSQRPLGAEAVLSISRDFSGILIVLILKTSGMGKWYLWDFDCLIPHQPF